MSSKILLDTNILVYAFDKESVFYQKSIAIFQHQELYATQNIIYEFYRTMTSKAYRQLISTEDVISAINFYQTRLTVLYPTSHTDFILNDLIKQYKPVSGRIWDMLIFAQALENNIDILYTKNTGDYPENPEIKIIDPTL